jgi:hypothetical protein
LGQIVIDDVSRLNGTPVHSIRQVRSLEDVQQVLNEARNLGVRVWNTRNETFDGRTKYLVKEGIIIDMKYVNQMEYLKEKEMVKVGGGASWGRFD